MSSRDGEEFGNDLLVAKERDLKPLREQSQDVLQLRYPQTEAMEDFLDLAWCAGLRAGRAQMEARAKEREPNIPAVAIKHFEADFKDLMEESADTLNLTLASTIGMWGFLHQAWMAGNRTCADELMRLYIEVNSDVPEEAQQWLKERDEGGESA